MHVQYVDCCIGVGGYSVGVRWLTACLIVLGAVWGCNDAHMLTLEVIMWG